VTQSVAEISPDLVERARRGDDAALEEVVRAAYGPVRRWALVQTGDPVEADDLTQDVLIRMIRRLDSYHGDSGFSTWLYAMTRNAAIDRFRSRARRTRLGDDPRIRWEAEAAAKHDPYNTLQTNELRTLIESFFEELPQRQREVFDLVELQGIPAPEVARLLGIEPVSVRANLFKARKRIRARILETSPEVAEDLS